jgi:hypothetical protein
MKYIKTYEDINDGKIPVGQYVIMSLGESSSSDNDTLKQIHSFLEKNIGQIVNKSDTGYIVKYDHIPDYMKFLSEIKEDKYGKNTISIGYLHTPKIIHSYNREELLPFIQSNKFNL